MLRRTFFAVGAAVVALGRRLRGQSRGELIRMAERQLAETPFKAGEIMGLESSSLVEIIEDPESSEFAKAKACQRLAVVGEEEAVPALAKLLGDPRLSHYARTALEPMPGAKADGALRDALRTASGSVLVGVINSIGVRRDPQAITALAGLRRSDNSEVAAAATSAIHRIRRP